jgi:hypothetical protein
VEVTFADSSAAANNGDGDSSGDASGNEEDYASAVMASLGVAGAVALAALI